MELGTDFAFVVRQVRIVIDGEGFYLDLLFYRRKLWRLVVIDLKLGELPTLDTGQGGRTMIPMHSFTKGKISSPETDDSTGDQQCGRDHGDCEPRRMALAPSQAYKVPITIAPRNAIEPEFHSVSMWRPVCSSCIRPRIACSVSSAIWFQPTRRLGNLEKSSGVPKVRSILVNLGNRLLGGKA